MSFFGTLKHIFTGPTAQNVAAAAAIGAVNAYSPGLGALVQTVGNAIVTVEAKANGATGADKKEQVKQIIDVSTPVTVSVLNQIAGKTIADPAALAPALDKLIDDIVALFNALGIFTTSGNVGANK